VTTKPEKATLNYYEELDVLFNYIDYQLRKRNFDQAAPAIIELYDSILYDSFLKNKKSALFQDNFEIVEDYQIDMDNENILICLIYIFSNRHKQLLFGVPRNEEERKYHKLRKTDLLLLKDSINRLILLKPNLDFIYKIKTRNEHYSLDKPFSLNPSSQNCYFAVSKQVKELRKKIKRVAQYTKLYWGPDIKNVFEYYLQSKEKLQDSDFEEIRAELLNAIVIVKNVLGKDHNAYYLYDLIGELYFLNNEKDTAKEYLLKSIELNPDYSLAWKNLFELLSELNDFHQIAQYAEKIIPFNINSDVDYNEYRQITRIGLKAFGKIQKYDKGIDFYVCTENSFSDYIKSRNDEIQLRLSNHYSFSHPTSVLYSKLPIDSSPEERLKVIEMIISKIGYDKSICEDYVLSYFAYKEGTILKKLTLSELENICIENDKNVPLSYFSMHGYGSELKFGKHKGEKVREIIKSDFDYLLWCVQNIGGFYLSPIILTKLIQEAGDKYIVFIKLNMIKHFLFERYKYEEYEREEEMKNNREDNSYGNSIKYAQAEYKDFGGIE
jgi:hypothetical protein